MWSPSNNCWPLLEWRQRRLWEFPRNSICALIAVCSFSFIPFFPHTWLTIPKRFWGWGNLPTYLRVGCYLHFAFTIAPEKESQQADITRRIVERESDRIELTCFQNTFIAKSVVVAVDRHCMAWKIHGFNCAKLCCLLSLASFGGQAKLSGFFTLLLK